MKEMVTVRLYENPPTGEWEDALHYRVSEDVRGWDFERGDQIDLQERNGGFLMGVIDHIEPRIFDDRTGRYKLAVVWTQD